MNKIALITGANTGIGFETAKGLLAKGYDIIMVCRSAGKGEPAKKRLLFLYPDREVYFYRCDLANFEHVRKTVDLIKVKFNCLDVIVNNAGYIPENIELTAEGHEKTFQTCHLGHFMLTMGLLDLLKKSDDGRVVNVSSMVYSMGKFDRLLKPSKNYKTWQVYGDAKLSNILFTMALAEHLEGTNVETYALHPGGVRSGFGHNLKGIMRGLISMLSPFLISVEKGAVTSIFLASSVKARGNSGKYFVKSTPQDLKGKEATIENAGSYGIRVWNGLQVLANKQSFNSHFQAAVRQLTNSIYQTLRGFNGPVTHQLITAFWASQPVTTPQCVMGQPQDIPIGRPIITSPLLTFSSFIKAGL